ncbi:6-carboxytetrahydropterin synthase QueD [Mesohalobacter halotolerans]|uniref:6-carboxy-5,6,7,8-tetrahydropterin synthase n=1 Tax=Mesohalobacter halotolerans TaxID=1883405 RepID=A0A4V6AL95_9FLAO|nr:6-carboxytetrahydropterin synthase QueD [Mesohalobacter halotolerans]MBS3737513.1 6-carboxytetrahydropterin synthase QueD [Psychroflexus sp.]TKS55695.1 6-carboxytetrahydropterin synthase QueD [Mesohalobacter halotolerans]
MSEIRITKQFTFEMAHALHGYDGKCKNIHGHSYKLDVCVIGEPIEDSSHPKCGMVIDFGDLKHIVKSEIVDKLDHAIMLNTNSPHQNLAQELQSSGHKIVEVNYQPTSENMVADFAETIKAKLDKNLRLHSLKLRETETAFAEWYAADQN